MRSVFRSIFLCLFLCATAAATIFARLQGVVHDAQHRPIRGVNVTIRAAHSDLHLNATTDDNGGFSLPTIPAGEYIVHLEAAGFRPVEQSITLASDTSPLLHFELQIGDVHESVTVSTDAQTSNVNSVTPTALINREDIAQTPGADRTSSLAMITDYVPGAYMAHDMLHMRGGHQVSWLIDGVEIPNTNIASNLGAQIDPKDIDYVEVQRGSYTSDVGDRTYGVFNVVPRTGFERDRQAELVLSAGSFLETNDQINFGDHSEKMAYYASLNGSRSDYGLSPPISKVHHDASNSYGGFASFIDNLTAKDQLRLVTQLRDDYFQIPYDPDPNSFENLQFDSSGLRDRQPTAWSPSPISIPSILRPCFKSRRSITTTARITNRTRQTPPWPPPPTAPRTTPGRRHRSPRRSHATRCRQASTPSVNTTAISSEPSSMTTAATRTSHCPTPPPAALSKSTSPITTRPPHG